MVKVSSACSGVGGVVSGCWVVVTSWWLCVLLWWLGFRPGPAGKNAIKVLFVYGVMAEIDNGLYMGGYM